MNHGVFAARPPHTDSEVDRGVDYRPQALLVREDANVTERHDACEAPIECKWCEGHRDAAEGLGNKHGGGATKMGIMIQRVCEATQAN